MLGWFHALLPREERFFEMFERHSHSICAGAKALRAMLEGGEAVEQQCRIVMDFRGSGLVARFFRRLIAKPRHAEDLVLSRVRRQSLEP